LFSVSLNLPSGKIAVEGKMMNRAMCYVINLRWASARVFVFFAAVALGIADAQTAFRCEVNGATVYSEKPCADGKAVAPTQDTDAQRQRAKDAATQMKADNRAVDARIDKRANEEAKARIAERRAVARADRTKAAAQKKKAAKAKATKAKIKVATTKPAKAKTPKTKSSKPAAGAKPS
jgi:hypothetical protein